MFTLDLDKDCIGKEGIDIDALWVDSVQDGTQYWDDMSGKVLEPGLIQAARREEIHEAERMGVWKKVPGAECIEVTGRPPIGTRWVDCTKGDDLHPNVRARLVAQEIRRDSIFELFVATPPIEYIKYLLSRAASSQSSARPICIMINVIKKAFSYAPATRPLYIQLPEEARGKARKIWWEDWK